MADCLGLFIGKNLIKYAKVSRNNNSIKINTYGVKTYTDINETLNQVINETDSLRIPISVNIDGEQYNYFNMSTLLNKKDLTKAINTEFESICYDKGENPKATESRFALINNSREKNLIKVIHVSEDKIKLNQLQNYFTGKKLIAAVPVSFGIANIVPINSKDNIAIVNIEDETSITIVEGEKIYEIRKLDIGAKTILDSINLKENSYTKAYEICKNTTIYTMDGQNIQEENNEYLSDIIPTLYEIGTRTKDIIDGLDMKIDKIYITGTAAIINNVDLYFNEILGTDICNILKPFFLEDNAQVNIKDCIEVNSAIGIALQGLQFGLKDINFIKTAATSAIDFSSVFSKKEGKSTKSGVGKSINISFLDGTLPFVKYCFAGVASVVVVYLLLSFYTVNEIELKNKQMQAVIDDTTEQISYIEKDVQKINRKSTQYLDLINDLKDAKNSLDAKASYKYSIPTLLSKIAQYIPKGVQITSIENPTGKKVIIAAQSISYEQLAYFKAELKQEGILRPDSVVSSQAVKSADDKLILVRPADGSPEYVRQVVKIVIEGELP